MARPMSTWRPCAAIRVLTSRRWAASNAGSCSWPTCRAGSTGGAYVSLRGHAVGVGRFNGQWMIMDPNLGLFCYASAAAQGFVDELNALALAYWQCKGRGSQTQMLLQVFVPV